MRTMALSGSIVLWLILSCIASYAAIVTLQWDANSEPDIAHYTLKWGFVPNGEDHEINVGNVTTYTISEPWSVGMTIYFVVTATNVADLESGPSNEVSFTINPWNPNAPGHLRIIDIDK